MRPRNFVCLVLLGGVFASTIALAQPNADAPARLDPSMMRVDVRASTPSLIALRYRHDLCPVCAAYEPRLREVVDFANRNDVLMLTIDLSSEATQRQSAMLLAQLGLEKFWPNDLRALGEFLFISPASGEVVHSMDLEAAVRDSGVGADELIAGIRAASRKRDAGR